MSCEAAPDHDFWLRGFDPTAYLGRPFDAARWNCWILVATVLNRELGLSVPTGKPGWPEPGDREAIEATFMEERRNYSTVADPAIFYSPYFRPQTGDIAMLRIYREVCHVAVIQSGRQALHVMEGTATYLADLASPEWRPRFVALYRHPDLDFDT